MKVHVWKEDKEPPEPSCSVTEQPQGLPIVRNSSCSMSLLDASTSTSGSSSHQPGDKEKSNKSATASTPATAGCWAAKEFEINRALWSSHRDVILGCRFHPSLRLLATWSADGLVKLWDLIDGRHSSKYRDVVHSLR